MELKLYMRQTQNLAFDYLGSIPLFSPIIYVGTNPNNLQVVQGTVPKPDYQDFTDYVSDLFKLKITWTTERDGQGLPVAGALLPKKVASGTLTFEADAFYYIKEWMADSVSAPLNSIDVKIEHVGCGTYDSFIIKPNQIQWCEDGTCTFDITLAQKDEPYDCIQRTLISDNWQGWFPEDNSIGTRKHPRFLYCKEIRPNGMMLMLWFISAILLMFIYILTPLINTIIAIVGVIVTIINAIKWLFGGHVNWGAAFNFFDPRDYADSFYLESSGCGRVHPSPLIRDYINNVCDKCGIKVDQDTAPIFYAKNINIQTSSEYNLGNISRSNPHYNATYFNAPVKRGIRIFKALFSNADNDSNIDTQHFWQDENKPLLTLDLFLDDLKTIYNAEWRLQTYNGQPYLYFWRKDWFTMGAKIYDFAGSDHNKIIAGICFGSNERTGNAYMQGLYSEDGIDTAGNEAKSYMDDLVSMGTYYNNTLFSGKLDKTAFKFGRTRFRLDGLGKDYILDAVQQLMNANVLIPGIMVFAANIVMQVMKKWADYALLMGSETASLAKIIIWDPASGYEFAKTISNMSPYNDGNASLYPMPAPNTVYNPNNKRWFETHQVDVSVLGSSLSIDPWSPDGYYILKDELGLLEYKRDARLGNYPMYFQAGYKNNIYDWFHYIDDNRYQPPSFRTFDLKIDLCCTDLTKLGVFDDSLNIKLGSKVSLPLPYNQDGTITEITASYDPEDENGQYIEIKGKV